MDARCRPPLPGLFGCCMKRWRQNSEQQHHQVSVLRQAESPEDQLPTLDGGMCRVRDDRTHLCHMPGEVGPCERLDWQGQQRQEGGRQGCTGSRGQGRWGHGLRVDGTTESDSQNTRTTTTTTNPPGTTTTPRYRRHSGGVVLPHLPRTPSAGPHPVLGLPHSQEEGEAGLPTAEKFWSDEGGRGKSQSGGGWNGTRHHPADPNPPPTQHSRKRTKRERNSISRAYGRFKRSRSSTSIPRQRSKTEPAR